MNDLKSSIRSIADFPKKGIVFRDISTLLADPDAFRKSLDLMERYARSRKVNKIAAIESRGFVFGGALADRMGISVIMIRKLGKLPGETIRQSYDLEYGDDSIEIQADAINKGDSVLIIDDLLATGGTLEAACKLIEKAGGRVAGIAVLIELSFLPWLEKLEGYDILSLVKYDTE